MSPVEKRDALSLDEVLDGMAAAGEGEEVPLGELLDSFGRRGFGPLLLIPGVLALAPTGAIPGMSVATGSLIALFSIQMLLPVEHPWVPRRLERITIGRKTLEKSIEKVRPVTSRLNLLIRPRLAAMTRPPAIWLIALTCIAMAALMFPLALVPFGVTPPAAAICLLALGLTSRDGLLVALGLGVAGLAVAMAAALI
jgi:hypothetical protein